MIIIDLEGADITGAGRLRSTVAPPTDENGIQPSANDSKRMLADYLAVKCSGSANEDARRFAKTAVQFVATVLHDRQTVRLDGELALVGGLRYFVAEDDLGASDGTR